VLEKNSPLAYEVVTNVPVGEIDFKEQDEVLENALFSLKRETAISNLDVSIDFQSDSNSFLLEFSDVPFIFEGQGSDSKDSYKIEGSIATLKG
jgi:hypothetical protein